MSTKTLFEAAKPIIFILNFMGYGLGWEKRKSGWVKGLLKWMLKINIILLFIIFLVFAAVYIFATKFDPKCISIYYSSRLYEVLLGVTFLDFFVLLNQNQLRNLVSQFRSFPVMIESGKELKKCLLSFYFYLAINIIPFVYIFWWLNAIAINYNKTIINTFLYLWLFPSLFLLFLFPVFLCYFACLVPIYCVAHLKQLGQEVKSARSSLRRAKMTSGLIREYYRLKRLASMTDETVSKAMSLFHQLFVMLFALINVLIDSSFYPTLVHYLRGYSLFFTIFFVHVFPFLMYKRVAPAANQMHSLIFKALVDIILIDDQRLSRDPVSHLLLIKMRASHVFHVSHMALAEASFTLFGEAIEGEALFTIFLEAFDMYNTIFAPKRHLSLSDGFRYQSFSC